MEWVWKKDTYTAPSIGSSENLARGAYFASNVLASFSIQVIGTGSAATAWDIRLYGSIDGTNYSEILKHDTSIGDGVILFSGANLYPSFYIRSRCISLTLGSATNVVCDIVGIP